MKPVVCLSKCFKLYVSMMVEVGSNSSSWVTISPQHLLCSCGCSFTTHPKGREVLRAWHIFFCLVVLMATNQSVNDRDSHTCKHGQCLWHEKQIIGSRTQIKHARLSVMELWSFPEQPFVVSHYDAVKRDKTTNFCDPETLWLLGCSAWIV